MAANIQSKIHFNTVVVSIFMKVLNEYLGNWYYHRKIVTLQWLLDIQLFSVYCPIAIIYNTLEN